MEQIKLYKLSVLIIQGFLTAHGSVLNREVSLIYELLSTTNESIMSIQMCAYAHT